MPKRLWPLFILLCSSSLFAGDNAMILERRSKLLELVNNEIQTIQNNQYSSLDLKHRLFELYTEKVKLIKEKETQNLLEQTPQSIAEKGKESFFINSRAQYKAALHYATNFISENPKYGRINEIYYTLALNSRDYDTGSETENYLKLAIKGSKEDEKTLYFSQVALAEFYYNNKNYNEAINYYNEILKKSEHEWYGKHLYNASWCYLKERNFKKALELIKLSFITVQNKKYVSMKEQVINAIGLFFIQADSTREGIDFFEKNTSPATPGLLLLAQSSMNKNTFSLTEEVLRAALKDTLKRKDPSSELKVRLVQLDIYRESKKDDLYFDTSNKILELSQKYKSDKIDLFLAINKIKEVAGFMQINLVKDKNADSPKYSKEDYKKIMRYFDILAFMDPKNLNLYRYFQGETALSIHEFQGALKYYVRSIKNSKAKKDFSDITKKSLETILSTLEITKMKKEREDEYAIFSLKNFVLFYPRSDKSQVFYQRLFNKYFEHHDVKKAVNILLAYEFYYPEDIKIHREMLSLVLDTYILEKNTDKIAFWIQKIEKGHLQFSLEYVQKSIAVLGGLLFNKYQILEKQGKMKEALKGYESIYESKKYPIRTKAEAAYAIATLYQDLNHVQDSYDWIERSFALYDNLNLLKIMPALYSLAKNYRLLQNFALSSELAQGLTERFCQVQFPDKSHLYELILMNGALIDSNSDHLIRLEEKFKHCSIEKRDIENSQLLAFDILISTSGTTNISHYAETHSQNEKLVRKMEHFLKAKFWQVSMEQKESIKIDIDNFLKHHQSLPLSDMIEHYERVKLFRKKIIELTFNFSNLPKFDEVKYNFELEQNFTIIAELVREANTLSKESTLEEMAIIREVLPLPYFALSEVIKNFAPQGVETKYKEGFKSGMRQITESLLAKGLQIVHENRSFFEKNIIFIENQKHAKFDNNKISNSSPAENDLQKSLLENINLHSALLFSNTIDLVRGQRK